MNVLLQGDVGSGKTVVAGLAMLIAAKNGAQAALMAPTEILAEQHAESLAAAHRTPGGNPRAGWYTVEVAVGQQALSQR